MKRKKLFALLLALSLLLSAAACGKKTEEEAPEEENLPSDSLSGKTLTGGVYADDLFSLPVDFKKGLNPLTTTSSVSIVLAGLVCDNVFEVDASYNLSSRIITEYSVNDDGNFWTLHVDTTIPMHDGTTLSAYDVAYSIQRAMIYSPLYAGRLYSVQGCTAYAEDQLCISTRYPDTRLPWRLTIPVIKRGSILSGAPVGTGPYMFAFGAVQEPEPTEEPAPEEPSEFLMTPPPSPSPTPEPVPDRLVAFESYGDGTPLPVDTIYLRQYTDPASMITEYESGLVDLVVNDPTGIYNLGYGGMNEKRVFPVTNMHYIGFNGYSDFFCYSSYRQVLTYLIDRAAIVDEVMDGWADEATLPVNPHSELYDRELADSLAYNTQQCQEALAALGCRDLDDDGELEFSLSGSKVEINLNFIVCSDTAAKVTAARRICSAMEELGFPVTLQELSWKDFQAALKNPQDEETRKATFDMYYDEVAITCDWDQMPFYEEDGALNYGMWKDDNAIAAITSYMSAGEGDQKERCREMCRTLSQEALVIPVCFEKKVIISHLNVIRGMSPSQYNYFTNMQNWTIRLQ